MSEEKYKYREWIPNDTNQIRLRHLRQICARCICPKPPATAETSTFYYTLHITMMSAPFYTSEFLSGDNIDWGDIDCRKFPESIVTACPGVVVRLWVQDKHIPSPELVTVWGVYLCGLVYLGSQLPKEGALFCENSLIFGTSWGYFVSSNSLKTLLIQPVQPPLDNASLSYSINSMCRIHRMQRAIYKEAMDSDQLRQEILMVQSHPTRFQRRSLRAVSSVTVSPGDQQLLQELRTKRQIAVARVSLLHQERGKQSRHLDQLKETLKNLRVDNHTRSLHLKEKMFHLQMSKERLSSMVRNAAGTEDENNRLRQQLAFRRRQLFHEIAEIFPIVQEKEGLYSINNVILPDSDSLAGCDDTQLSVALGHVTHLVQLISIFLQVPNRYPVFVRSSKSTIVDQATLRDLEIQKEFPLYLKGKDRLYFEYAVYLLNKNIAQLRWICGMSTQDLAATLPNLASLLQHLLLLPSVSLENGKTNKTRVEDKEKTGTVPRSAATSTSSMEHLMKSKWHQHRGSCSLAGSQMSLTNLSDQCMTSTTSLDHLTDSPQAGGYFKRPPSQQHWVNSSTVSLDLAVDQLHLSTSPPSSFSPIQLQSHRGSAPDLCSPELTALSPAAFLAVEDTVSAKETVVAEETVVAHEPVVVEEPLVAEEVSRSPVISSPAVQEAPTVKEALPKQAEENGAGPISKASTDLLLDSEQFIQDYPFLDEVLNNVSARTEALANTSSSFKLKGRGWHPSAHGNA